MSNGNFVLFKTTSVVVFLAMSLNFSDAAENTVSDSTGEGEKGLSLAEAKKIAFQNNWDLLAAKSDVDLAVAQKLVVREFPNPGFSLGTSGISANGRGNSTEAGNGFWQRNYDTVVAVGQLFEISGKRSSRKASAAAGLRGAEARLLNARRVLEAGVTQAYVEALLAQANADILKQSAESLRKEADIADARLKAGDISRVDKSQIEIEAEKLELDSSTASSAAVTAKIAVEVLMGVNQPAGDWTPGDALEELAKETVELPANNFAPNRPDLIAADASMKQAEAELKLQKALRIPDPTVELSYEHQPPGELTHTLGIGLSFPLPLWNRNKGAIRAAEVARDQAAIQLRKVEAQMAADIIIARRNYENASQRLRRQRDEIQPKSAEIRQAVSFAFEKGSASLLDLLSAQRNDNQVRLATVQSAAETARALAELKAALNLNSTNSYSP